ncbi:MAG: pilus assembly protein TadG-related protein [Hyphomonas sp.]
MAILFALIAPVASLMMAMAIDLGMVNLQRRELQSMTDLAAITAAGDPQKAEMRVLTLLTENGFGDVQLLTEAGRPTRLDPRFPSRAWVEVVKGHYVADATLPPATRFEAGGEPLNAVMVTVVRSGQYFIMSGVKEPSLITTTGVAYSTPEAAFSVGSRLARVEGGVLNALLGSLIGSELNLTAMDYDALLNTDISLIPMLDFLAADLNLTAATYEDILDTRISVARLAAIIRQSGALDVQTRAALGKIEQSAGALSTRIRLSDAIDLGTAGRFKPADTRAKPSLHVPVMGLLTAAITSSNGDHQVALDLGGAIPGLLKTSAELRIGERPQNSPWLRMSGSSAVVTTAQTRLKMDIEVPGLALLAGSKVRIPLYVEVASAQAQLKKVSCQAAGSGGSAVTVAAQPAVGRVMIGEVGRNDFEQMERTMHVSLTRIAETLLLRVRAKSDVRMGNERSTDLSFTRADIDAGRAKTATTRNYTSSLLGSALRDLELRIDAGPLSLATPSLVQAALSATLTPVLEPVDGAVYNLLAALGVHLGEADVRVHGISCQVPVLVQ